MSDPTCAVPGIPSAKDISIGSLTCDMPAVPSFQGPVLVKISLVTKKKSQGKKIIHQELLPNLLGVSKPGPRYSPYFSMPKEK